MFLKPGIVCIILSVGYPMIVRQSVKELQWLAYIVPRRNNATHAGNEWEVHLTVVPIVKIDGCCGEERDLWLN